jgi:hypothetical protein
MGSSMWSPMAELYRESFELTETEVWRYSLGLALTGEDKKEVELANCHEQGPGIQDMTMLLAREQTLQVTANK